MPLLDFALVTAPSMLLPALRQIAEDAPNGQYTWLLEATRTTLDQYTRSEILTNPPNNDRFDPNHVEEHIEEASALIDACLQRRAQCFQIEATAYHAAMTYELEEQLHPHEIACALARYHADCVVSGLPFTNAERESVQQKFLVIQQSRHVKQIQHSIAGHALNYGEQIRQLRRIYADDVRTILERLYALRVGLWFGFNIRMRRLPDIAITNEHLEATMFWLRDAIDLLETAQRREREFTVQVMLGDQNFVPGLTDRLRTPNGDVDVVFSLPAGLFGANDSLSVRTLACGAAITFSEDGTLEEALASATPDAKTSWQMRADNNRRIRQAICFNIEMHLPRQGGQLEAGEVVEWSKEKFLLSSVAPWTPESGGADPGIQVHSPRHLHNASPVGEWRITIPARANAPHGQFARGALGNAAAPSLRLQDIALLIHVAAIR